MDDSLRDRIRLDSVTCVVDADPGIDLRGLPAGPMLPKTLIIHARWGGVAKCRGIAVLSVFGGIVTAWSWFGVNQLGVGLHSYGFTDSVTFWLLVFVVSQLLIMGLGLLPRRIWRSQPSGARRSSATTVNIAG